MEVAFRDLDRIREREDDTKVSRAIITVVASVVACTVIFCVGLIIGRPKAHSLDPHGPDPFDSPELAEPLKKLAQAQPADLTVDEKNLSFHRVLRDDEQQELEASLASAYAEEVNPQPDVNHLAQAPVPAQALPAAHTVVGQPIAPMNQPVVNAQPAAHAEPSLWPEAALPGETYSLYVFGYASATPAQSLANNLRGRGHQAYVAPATEGQSALWRVLLGPFASKNDALRYREGFETRERLNTFVIKNSS